MGDKEDGSEIVNWIAFGELENRSINIAVHKCKDSHIAVHNVKNFEIAKEKTYKKGEPDEFKARDVVITQKDGTKVVISMVS